MNKCQFEALNVEERTKHAWVFGKLLESRNGNQISFYLYQVADFFVEMIFNCHKKKILNVYAFSDEKTLNKYFDEISLNHLFEEK